MARLPSAADLGAAPAADASRPVASIDTSAYARGGAALAQGGAELGKGLQVAGQGLSIVGVDEQRFQYAKAHADFLSGLVDLNSKTLQDTNPGKDESGKTLVERYGDNATKLQNDAADAAGLSGAMRDRFISESNVQLAKGAAEANSHAVRLQNSADIAGVNATGNTMINQGIATGDDDTRRQLIDAHNRLIDGLVAKGAYTPELGFQAKQEWARQFATADLMHRADTDPQGVINELRAAPGSDADLTNRILRVEGQGKNPNSSAQGAGQFIDSTWLDVLKRNRPDLAQGRSDAELLALRADKNLGRELTDDYRRENATYLQGQGVQATPGAQYLAHFLGPKGAAAVLKADPNAPVADALTQAVGGKKAQEMIAANPSILRGQLAGSVRQWADAKMGGQVPGGGSIYDIVRPDVREEILARARTQQQKQLVDDLSGFKQQIEDSQAEALRTGAVTKPLTLSDFAAHLGAEFAPKAFANYQANIQLGKDVARVSTLDPDAQNKLVDSYAPQPGAEGYADAVKRQAALAKAIDQANKEKAADPATFAINRLPASGSAYKAFADANPADADARGAAAQKYAATTLLEQGNVGVAADNQRILPKGYAENFTKQLQKSGDADEAQARVAVIGQVQAEAKMWGQYWPQVMRELAPSTQPIVRAIAAGADTAALTRLLSLDPKATAKTIIGEQNETKLSDVAGAVNTAMAPFRQTLVGRQLDRDFPGYQGLAMKLAALYTRDGDDASTAATKAFNALIGNRYDFRDSYRIPKSAGVSADDVQAGAVAARDELGKLGAVPPVDDIPGRSNAAADDLAIVARDGKWVTAPDNSGLNLAYGDKFVRGKDGAPLKLSWAQLGALGKAHAGESRVAPPDTGGETLLP